MPPSLRTLNWKTLAVLFPFFAFFVGAFFTSPLPQSEHYHFFADERFFFVPNYSNVFSNLIFMFVGYYGALQIDFGKLDHNEKYYLTTFLVAVFFTGFGSMYYHLMPNTQTLVWDRLPMGIAFGSFTAWLLAKTIFVHIKDKNYDFYVFIFLVILSVFSVFYWDYTQTLGRGDLRIYYSVQFGTILTTLMAVLVYDKSYFPKKACIFLFIFYVLAKIVEGYDQQIYQLTFKVISGHALKHLFAGYGCFLFLRYLKTQ